jgi:dolichol kinase
VSRGALRPLVHAGMLGFVILTPVLGKWGMAGVALAAFLLNLLVLPRTAFGRALARPGEPSWNGLVTYPLAVALAYALFWPEIAAMAWAVMALADPAATLVGTARTWRVRVFYNPRKSLAGSVAFLLAGFAAATSAVALTWGWEPRLTPAIGAMAALVGALVESLPIPLDDNLPVVLAVGGLLTWLSGPLGNL